MVGYIYLPSVNIGDGFSYRKKNFKKGKISFIHFSLRIVVCYF